MKTVGGTFLAHFDGAPLGRWVACSRGGQAKGLRDHRPATIRELAEALGEEPRSLLTDGESSI